MKIKPFALERYFAAHEFSAPFLLSCSDAEPLALAELLKMADPDALRLWQGLSLGYTDSQGHPLLLAEIEGLYAGIPADHIVEVVPEEGIFIAMNVLLKAGDHVIVTHPGYQSLYEIALSIGCTVSWWEPDMPSDMAFSIDDLQGLIRPNTRLIVVNFPHNPTGALITKAEQDALVAIAAAHNIHLFSDEMYRFSEIDADDRLPAMVDKFEKGITLGGLSKSFSLPGLRVGWLASPDSEFIAAVKAFKDYTTICGSAPSEILAVIALRSRMQILDRLQGIIGHNLSVLEEFFQTYKSVFRWVQPKGGTITFPELFINKSVDDFCQALIKDEGVMLLPASILGYGGNHARIGFGRKDMPDVLGRLASYLDKN